MGNSDPVLSLLKDLSYNVVRLPRTGIRPLQILEKQDNDLVVLGEAADLFRTGSVASPSIGPEEPAAFINGTRTRDLRISVGLSLLGGIVGAMMNARVKLDVAYKRAIGLAFEFADVTVNQVNQLQLSKYLTAASIDEQVGPPAKLLEADKLYLIISTIKSRKFIVEALQSGGTSASVDLPVLKQIVGRSVQVKADSNGSSKLIYEGNTPLVFGFQAVRMEFEAGVFKGFARLKSDAAAIRSIDAAADNVEQRIEMLTTVAPFANFINSLPDTLSGTNKSSTAKPDGAKRGSTKRGSTKRSSTKQAAQSAATGNVTATKRTRGSSSGKRHR